MKPIKTEKQLTPEEALEYGKREGWPTKTEFRFSDSTGSVNDTLRNVVIGGYRSPFRDKYGYLWHHCALVTERMPRDVPEGVPPLPEDKPLMVYVGHGPLSESITAVINKTWLWYLLSIGKEWVYGPNSGKHEVPYAADLSDPEARKHFPEYAEAMADEIAEYEASKQPVPSDGTGAKIVPVPCGRVAKAGEIWAGPCDCYPDEPCLVGCSYDDERTDICRLNGMFSSCSREISEANGDTFLAKGLETYYREKFAKPVLEYIKEVRKTGPALTKMLDALGIKGGAE